MALSPGGRMTSYALECWRAGIIGCNHPIDPRRVILAMIRHRGAEAEAIQRFLVLSDIRAELAAELASERTGP